MNIIQFENYIDSFYGCTAEPGRCGEDHGATGTNHKPIIEVTLNPKFTNCFDGSESAYLKVFNLILKYLKEDKECQTRFKVFDYKYAFEFTERSKQRHLHAWIELDVIAPFTPWGLILVIADILSKKFRRKIPREALMDRFIRIEAHPFCLQYDFRDQRGRIDYWKNYIVKDVIIKDD